MLKREGKGQDHQGRAHDDREVDQEPQPSGPMPHKAFQPSPHGYGSTFTPLRARCEPTASRIRS